MTIVTCKQFYLFLFVFFLSIALFVFEPKLLFWVQSHFTQFTPTFNKIKCTWFLNMKVFVDSNFWINGKNACSLFSKFWGVTLPDRHLSQGEARWGWGRREKDVRDGVFPLFFRFVYLKWNILRTVRPNYKPFSLLRSSRRDL